MFFLVQAYPGCPGQTAVKWLLLFLRIIILKLENRQIHENRPICIGVIHFQTIVCTRLLNMHLFFTADSLPILDADS